MRRVVAYARADADIAEPGRRHDYARSIAAIESWARAHDAAVVTVAVEPAASGIEGTGDRVGFLNALSAVREGEADSICVASLDELDPDMVVQEFLLGEARGSHVQLLSASAADDARLADPPQDPARALVRRVINDHPRFQGEMRSLRAWARRLDTIEGLDRLAPTLAAFEEMQEHGADLAPGDRRRSHRLANVLRLRRA